MRYLGDFATGTTVRFMWGSSAQSGASITRATNGSIRIYKNNGVTERASSSGITDTEDFDGLTGVHALSVDLSDNADAGFYAAGSDYSAVLVGAVIDGLTVNVCLAEFSIQNRYHPITTAQAARLDVDVSSRPTAAAIRAELDASSTKLANLDGTVSSRLATADYTAPPSAVAVRSEIDSNSTKLDVTVGSRLATAGYTAPDNAGIASAVAQTDSIEGRLPVALVGGRIAAVAEVVSDKSGYSLTVTPPTAVQVRQEIDSNSTKLDVAIGTRLSTAGYTAPDNTGIGVAAAAAAIAATDTGTLTGRLTAPRAALLDNLDAAISTRLAGAGYSAAPTADANADALLDRANGIESGWTFRQIMRIISSALGGEVAISGATVTIRNVTDAKARITATTDADGQRTAVTLDAT